VQTYTFSEMDPVLERLLSDRRLDKMPPEMHRAPDDEQPAPRAAFWLLDREMPHTAENLHVEHIPQVLGELYVYGRETDREPRIEFVTVKRPGYEEAVRDVRAFLGDQGGEPQAEEQVGQVPTSMEALSWRWRFPQDVTVQKRQELGDQKRRETTLNVWPETPLGVLDGKCPREAARDPRGRVRVLAAILLMELHSGMAGWEEVFHRLRTKLGLPQPEDVPAEGVDMVELPACRLHRLPPEKLSDEQLIEAFQRSAFLRFPQACLRLGPEIVRRTSLHPRVDIASVYASMSITSPDTEKALSLIQQAQQAATRAGRSPARYLLRELHLRTARAEGDECQRLFRILQSQYASEPGISEGLYRWLVDVGAITPDGQPRQPEGAPPAGPSQPAGTEGETGEPQPGGLWTPGQPDKPAEKKGSSGLWLPRQ
jgi:hypothetical protein